MWFRIPPSPDVMSCLGLVVSCLVGIDRYLGLNETAIHATFTYFIVLLLPREGDILIVVLEGGPDV